MILTQIIGHTPALSLANNYIARLLPTHSDPQGCLDTADQSHSRNEPQRTHTGFGFTEGAKANGILIVGVKIPPKKGIVF